MPADPRQRASPLTAGHDVEIGLGWRSMRFGRITVLGLALAVIAAAVTMIYFWQPLRDAPVLAPKGAEPTLPAPRDIDEIRARVAPALTSQLKSQQLSFGSPLFIRIFKETKELEVWIAKGERYEKVKTYPICVYSGDLGPKLREGDRQSPEGVYAVTTSLLNPNSSYHLSFNLGFPNAYDTHHGRTGSFLMVHGRCSSIGCYAMTDPAIEEIYVLVEAALRSGQNAVPVHIFPFRMTPENLEKHKQSPWISFWNELKAIHNAFEATASPPRVDVNAGAYILVRR